MTLHFQWKINIDHQCHYRTNKLQTFNFNTIGLFNLTSNFGTFFSSHLSFRTGLSGISTHCSTHWIQCCCWPSKRKPKRCWPQTQWQVAVQGHKAAAISSLYLTFEEQLLGKSRRSNFLLFTLMPNPYPSPVTEESEGSNWTAEQTDRIHRSHFESWRSSTVLNKFHPRRTYTARAEDRRAQTWMRNLLWTFMLVPRCVENIPAQSLPAF